MKMEEIYNEPETTTIKKVTQFDKESSLELSAGAS